MLPDLLWQTSFKKNININTKWIYYFLNTYYYKKHISKLATGTSKNMPNITKENFLNIKVAVPKVERQDKIVEIILSWDKAKHSRGRF
ncbi:restriction endonuclease subunit S [Cellulosilyticum sp. I15G10I2]|uniref:restriction endonuclease subunit S n=1 Tax=Cellulosilyticum sp. I15G10I2 TaxID=1892843 RepID=UPI00085C47B5